MRTAVLALLLLSLCAVGCATSAPASLPTVPSPMIPTDRPLQVAFLIVDGVYNTELTAPLDIFHHTPFHTKPAPGMAVYTVSPDGEPVRTFEGLLITPDHDFASAPEPDVLVVPSAEHSMDTDLDNAEMIGWVAQKGRAAKFVMSLCDGAFVLAKAGLLDGRASTTFPSDVDRYAETFPQLDVRRGVSFVHDGPALTSQGGARSFDVALYLVAHLWGADTARRVGRGLVLPWPMPGLEAVVVPPRSAEK